MFVDAVQTLAGRGGVRATADLLHPATWRRPAVYEVTFVGNHARAAVVKDTLNDIAAGRVQ